MEPLSDFAVKTHAELLRLAGEARAKCPGHVCADLAPCRHCAEYRRLHAAIDDHLAQLRGEPAEPSPLQNALLADYATDTVTLSRKPECSMCDGYRMVKADVLICTRCDHWPLPTLGLGGAK